ncbi:SRPBCC domain-containing protein [Bradyrhizobium sp.]|uniref:SRPBCC domain-containing protein n=1 Tax=Bradyrhizobium sp. TaxID=376 RepID=UPI0025BBFC08|nr:SRPBCC domain-containing protein [Bradyrhizobium sp.]
MSILTTVTFRFQTPAGPETVWRSLTDEPRHFPGLTIDSDWRAGSTVRLGSGGLAIVGRVLRCEPVARLSHTLGDHPARPEVYVTWELTPIAGGTVVELYVDELGDGRDITGARPEDIAEIESAWQPVVDALRTVIDRCIR